MEEIDMEEKGIETLSLEEKDKKIKKVKNFLSPVVLITILKLPLLVMAKENGGNPPPPPAELPTPRTTNNAAAILYLSANICTGIYQLWRNIDSPNKTYPEFLKDCVEMVIKLFDKTCPAPPPGVGPGQKPPAFLNSFAFLNALKSSPYAGPLMGGTVLFICLLSVYTSLFLNSKEEEKK